MGDKHRRSGLDDERGPAMSTPALSPLPITSRPVRARLDQVKADLTRDMQARLGRDATWNEVAERLLDAYDRVGFITRSALPLPERPGE
jgi:hypothetical protein